MQNKILVLSFLLIGLFVSCDNENELLAEYTIARPVKMSIAEFKSSVTVTNAVPILDAGKIYNYKQYVFVNDKERGIHVIDNRNPADPRKVAFITIPGNVDIAVKDDLLYADSMSDLVVLDISDINSISEVKRLDDVLGNHLIYPVADLYDYEEIDYQNEIIIRWEATKELRLVSEFEQRNDIITLENFNDQASPAVPANSGQGGSLARFKIVSDYLYAVDSHAINIFNIQNLDAIQEFPDVYAGFDIETIFNRGQHLFLGSMRGMYIYDIADPSVPSFVSEFQHGTACDPVVVDGDYAYVTLRGGNLCGATESGLFIVDISDISNPTLATSYAMESPYGLGIKDEKLFVCDGAAGLKVYDKTNINNLQKLDQFKNINTYDVIPLQEHLLMIGDNVLYQYAYENNGISLISAITLE